MLISMIITGVLLMAWGFRAVKFGRRPYDLIGAIILPIVLLATLVATVVFLLPDFFKDTF